MNAIESAAIARIKQVSRQEQEKLILKHTHRDFKGSDGRSIMQNRNGASCTVDVSCLSEQEFEEKLNSAARKERAERTRDLVDAVVQRHGAPKLPEGYRQQWCTDLAAARDLFAENGILADWPEMAPHRAAIAADIDKEIHREQQALESSGPATLER
ncbi:hypothetical protein [Ferrimonas marina]|uniref:Uncharacterized protein n=1 Tax=Ferrimonas marina TaxID=299255 RepID=A0A1M5UAI5_9GAMM|nr:hypothetical protein [Ferrimonas marina]SHH59969.1 hypothetical protein SAMN02745129_2477 [Ferrimonas marina]